MKAPRLHSRCTTVRPQRPPSTAPARALGPRPQPSPSKSPSAMEDALLPSGSTPDEVGGRPDVQNHVLGRREGAITSGDRYQKASAMVDQVPGLPLPLVASLQVLLWTCSAVVHSGFLHPSLTSHSYPLPYSCLERRITQFSCHGLCVVHVEVGCEARM